MCRKSCVLAVRWYITNFWKLPLLLKKKVKLVYIRITYSNSNYKSLKTYIVKVKATIIQLYAQPKHDDARFVSCKIKSEHSRFWLAAGHQSLLGCCWRCVDRRISVYILKRCLFRLLQVVKLGVMFSWSVGPQMAWVQWLAPPAHN